MRIAEIFDAEEKSVSPAYALRARSLVEGMGEVDEVWLWDYPFRRPAIRRLKNAPLLRERLAKCDLIIGNQSVAAATAGRAGLNVPVIFDCHTYYPAEAKLNWRLQPTRRTMMDYLMALLVETQAWRHVDHILVTASETRDVYLRKGVPPEKMTMVRNGVELADFPFAPLPPDGKRRMVYGGGMQIYQGVRFLIESYATYRGPAIELYIVGFGPPDSELRELAEKAGIITQGYEPREKFIRQVQTGHWGVNVFTALASRIKRECFPTKFAEYLALGRPVLLTDSNDASVMARENGLGIVVEPSGPALHEAFKRAATMPFSEMEEMADRGRWFVEEQMTWGHMREAFRGALDIPSQGDFLKFI